MNVLELYSGIGGMHYALQELSLEFNVVAAIDINTVANRVYSHNFPHTRSLSKLIESFSVQEFNLFEADVIVMSPPCQPFTRVGKQGDTSDSRCKSFLHLLDLIPRLSPLPRYILLENVKGFELSESHEALCNCLNVAGYNYAEFLISPVDVHVPNSRLRYYLVAMQRPLKFSFDSSDVVHGVPSFAGLPGSCGPDNGERCLCDEAKHPCCRDPVMGKISDYLEEHVDERFYLPRNLLIKRMKVADFVSKNCRRSNCFTKAYSKYFEGSGSLLMDGGENIHQMLACKQTSADVAVPDSPTVRFFTPKEVSRLMCFPESFDFPDDITDKQKWRLLGNSLNVKVVGELLRCCILPDLADTKP